MGRCSSVTPLQEEVNTVVSLPISGKTLHTPPCGGRFTRTSICALEDSVVARTLKLKIPSKLCPEKKSEVPEAPRGQISLSLRSTPWLAAQLTYTGSLLLISCAVNAKGLPRFNCNGFCVRTVDKETDNMPIGFDP